MQIPRLWVVCGMLMLALSAHAGEPNAGDLERAITGGGLKPYHAVLSKWLDGKTPADAGGITEASMQALLEDPAFRNALAQHRLVAKFGADSLDAFARTGKDDAAFLAWLMRNTEAMDLYLEGATPVGIRQRDADTWTLSTRSLDIWKTIHLADADARKGIAQRLAIAIGLNPPGTGNQGAGQAKTPPSPLDRYKHYKAAHGNGELFPSFDGLTVWDLRQIVSSNASNADLAWGREMINTWRPDLRAGEKVVLSTGRVWRRGSPYGYTDTFKSVMEGGGKCGPRSSWAVFICQAFGVPATGVRQPGHVCVAWRTPSGAWRLGYGRGWHVSKVMGMSGPEFLAATEARAHAAEFSQVEHLRWLASALASKERAAAVMAVAKKVSRAQPPEKVDLAGKVETSKGLPMNPKAPEFREEAPIKVPPGIIHIEAEAFAKMGGQVSYGGLQVPGVCVHNCTTGGRQIHFQSHMKSAWIEYQVDIPKAGGYDVQLRVAVANREQVLDVAVGEQQAKVKIPNTYGLWATTAPVTLRLDKGAHTLRLSTPFQRGVTVRWLRLAPRR